jgi:hypothetical protein
MSFKIKNSDLFLLPGNNHMLHLATIGSGLREFIVMMCVRDPHWVTPDSRQSYRGRIYIEEAVLESKDFSKDVWANLKFIAEDNLANDLANFAQEHHLLDPGEIMAKVLTYEPYAPIRQVLFPAK